MPRQATSEAKNAQSTAGTNAAQYGANASNMFGGLTSEANNLVQSKGYDPQTLAAITNATMGANNSAYGGAAGDIKRTAARTGNTAGVAGQEDTLAQNKGISGGQAAGDVQIANQGFANQQRTQGLNLLNSLYGTNVNAQLGNEGARTGDINAQTAAGPGWMQNLTGILGAVSQGAGAAAGAAKGCWIAARIFGGWLDPRTILVRHWIFDVWAKQSKVGKVISELYEKYGFQLSRNRAVVWMLRPLFMLALKRAQDGLFA